ncbi:MAG: patatin-like phospholipase family protein [Deltaproteobacteria bacterium]
MGIPPNSTAFILSGGGARSAYQLGVLKYIFSEMGCVPESPIFVGSSAGAINAYFLSLRAHHGFSKAIIDLCNIWSSLTVDRVFRTDSWSIVKGVGNFVYNFTIGRYVRQRHIESIFNTEPLYELLKNIIVSEYHFLDKNIEAGSVRALGISAMQYGTGRTITFFQASEKSGIQPWTLLRREGRPAKLRLKHVLASAAIPLVFPSVKIENSYYADGSVRATAPLSPAIHLGGSKILGIGLRTIAQQSQPIENYPSMSQVIAMMLNTVFLDSIDFDVRVLERVNELIEKLPKEERGKLRPIDPFLIRPSEDLGLLSLPYKDCVPKTLKFLMKGLGPTDQRGADFLSYILFDKHYINALIEKGFQDAYAQREILHHFFKKSNQRMKDLP